MKPEKIDNVNKPSHYQGSKGLESIEVIDNFMGNLPGKAAASTQRRHPNGRAVVKIEVDDEG